jgi:hypothetical protein
VHDDRSYVCTSEGYFIPLEEGMFGQNTLFGDEGHFLTLADDQSTPTYTLAQLRNNTYAKGHKDRFFGDFLHRLLFKKQGGIINKYKQGNKMSTNKNTKKEKPAGYSFSSRTQTFTPGYSLTNQTFFPYYVRVNQSGQKYQGYDDFSGERGRVIYNTPYSSDTVYYNYPDKIITTDDGGMMEIGTTKDQDTAKKLFYQKINSSKPFDDEESKKAYDRAKIHKNAGGGVMNQ